MVKSHTIAALVVGAVVVAAAPAPARAKDLEALSKLLSTVYLAQHFSVICAAERPSFGGDTSGPLGTMNAYAQHIKEDVIAGLEAKEAHSVLESAADAARSVARAELRAIARAGDPDFRRSLFAWCDTNAKPFVLRIIETHDQRHDFLARKIAAAKME